MYYLFCILFCRIDYFAFSDSIHTGILLIEGAIFPVLATVRGVWGDKDDLTHIILRYQGIMAGISNVFH